MYTAIDNSWPPTKGSAVANWHNIHLKVQCQLVENEKSQLTKSTQYPKQGRGGLGTLRRLGFQVSQWGSTQRTSVSDGHWPGSSCQAWRLPNA